MAGSERPAMPAPGRRGYRRPLQIVEHIKELIVSTGLRPGDRLPPERELMTRFQASRSTVREALGALQAQGLVRTRTGPGGGVFVAELDGGRAMTLLGNYFYFRQPSIGDICRLRCLLEPELAASVAGRLDEDDFRRLRDTVRLHDHPPGDAEEEFRQRIAELDFHGVLAELTPNPVLGFVCGFLQNLLRELGICQRIHDTPDPRLRESALDYQLRLLTVLHAGDAQAAREVMREHMAAAQAYMESREAVLASGFLRVEREA